MLLTDKTLLDVADLPLPADRADEQTLSMDLERWEENAIREALRRTEGNVARAAQMLGIVRDTLSSKIKKYGIDRRHA